MTLWFFFLVGTVALWFVIFDREIKWIVGSENYLKKLIVFQWDVNANVLGLPVGNCIG